MGVRINFTLEFSARQNVMVSSIAKPNYQNVFLGRIGAYIQNSGLGDGSGAGERTVISAQKWITELTKKNMQPTRLIAASLRNEVQLETLAGVDVYTMPTKVAADGKANLSGKFKSKLEEIYSVDLRENAKEYFPEKLWDVSSDELELATFLDKNCPENGDELIAHAHKAGCGDMFPKLSDDDFKFIAEDGKIPKHNRWAKRIKKGELAIDTLLNLAGLASFAADQKELDERVKKIITGD
jgi:transaldolase